MRISLNGVSAEIIGDPHLGRKFETGVPMSRRGDREQLVNMDFQDRMLREANIMICMGDLFDKFVVAPEVELFAASQFNQGKALMKIVLRGNHDASRNRALKSSFDVFDELLRFSPSCLVVKEEPLFWQVRQDEFIVLLPWHPFKNAKEMAQIALKEWKQKLPGMKVLAAFGHWDTQDFSEFGGNTDNLVPLAELRQMTDTIYTGHVHTPGMKMIGNIKIISTGSMQPYTHGEDPNGEFYETLTLEELRQRDPATLKNKCLRVELADGEELPDDIEALQITRYTRKPKGEDDKPQEVRIDAFDLSKLFDEAMIDGKVPDAIAAKIKQRFEESKR